MRYGYYLLCPAPAILFLVSLLAPNDWAVGGPTVRFQLLLLVLIAISSLVLTFLGLLLVALAVADHKSKLGPLVATIIAALPGLYLLIVSHLAHG